MVPWTYRFRVGECDCLAIRDDQPRYPVDMFATNLPKDVYRPWLAASGGSDFVDVPYTCLFVDTGALRLLIDTGGGPKEDRPFANRLLSELRGHGIEAGHIDLVVLTHAHSDHVGSCLDQHGRPMFSNARYVISQSEWDFWIAEPTLSELPVDDAFKQRMRRSASANLRGIESQLDVVECGAALAPGITVLDARGHSPGHIAVEIVSSGERLLFVGDAFVLPLHISYPETIGMTDHDPSEVVSTRMRLLALAADNRTLVATSHFAFPGLGRVRSTVDGWRWEAIAASAQ
jgi:glyoxylase-like metal-dependent hydrolase (beta-lactamase superfamily II)